MPSEIQNHPKLVSLYTNSAESSSENLRVSELQIKRVIDDNSKIIFLFLDKNIYCDPSLEPSRQYGSYEGSQNMFLWRNIHVANYP